MRLSPIMMTTMAALIGTLPIALGFGSGAESRRPLGLAVVGGLVFSQILMLYITPIFYTYMESLQGFLGRTFPQRRARVAESPSSTNRHWSRWEGATSTRSALCRNTRSSTTARPSDEFSRRRPQLEELVMSFAD